MVAFFCLCACVITCRRCIIWWWCGLTHGLVMYPPGGRGCYRTPWGSPSVSTCSRQSGSPHLRWVDTLINMKCFFKVLIVFYWIINVWLTHRVSFKLTWCIFMSLQACTLLLSVLFVYDVFFVFITPFFTKVRQDCFHSRLFRCLLSQYLCVALTLPTVFSPQSGESIMVEVAAGPSDSSIHEKVSLFSNSTSPLWVGWGLV